MSALSADRHPLVPFSWSQISSALPIIFAHELPDTLCSATRRGPEVRNEK
jgi:hypothetical protein